MSSSKFEYYVESSNVSIHNPEIVPLLLHCRWFGQDRLKKENWLGVSHITDSSRKYTTTHSFYYKVLWVSFEISEGEPMRKAVLSLEGEIFSDEKVFALLWLDLNRPKDRCGITLSPVPFGLNGKPQIPDEPGLRAIMNNLATSPFIDWNNLKCFLENIVIYARLQGINANKVDPERILDILCSMRIIEMQDNGKICRQIMDCDKIRSIFGIQSQK